MLELVDALPAVAAVALLLFFAACALTNIAGLAMVATGRRRSTSLIPWIGALAGCIGLLIAPWPGWRGWWWAPWALDLSVAATLLAPAVKRWRRRGSAKPGSDDEGRGND